MKIGFICHEYPAITAAFGGIGTATQVIAESLVKSGHQAIVYVPSSTTLSSSQINGVVIKVINCKGTINTILQCKQQLRGDRQAGHADLIESPECTAHLMPKISGTVVRLHGSHHFWCQTLPQKKRLLRLLLEQWGVRSATGLIAVSRFTAEITRKAMGLGDLAIPVIYNPVDTDFFAPQANGAEPMQISFVGSVVEKKGIRELCLAMPMVLKKFPEAILKVAGRDCRGPQGEMSFTELIKKELDDATLKHIHFLGPQSRLAVKELMTSSAVCVFPSYMETQGIVVAEAMATGRPVIVGRTGPGPEVMGEDGECGWLVDPKNPETIGERICRLLTSPDVAAEMGERARKRAVERFSVDVCMRRNLEFYNEMMKRC